MKKIRDFQARCSRSCWRECGCTRFAADNETLPTAAVAAIRMTRPRLMACWMMLHGKMLDGTGTILWRRPDIDAPKVKNLCEAWRCMMTRTSISRLNTPRPNPKKIVADITDHNGKCLGG